MINFCLKWFLCVGGAWLIILYGVKLFGYKFDVIRKHFFLFCLLAYGIATAAEFGGSKPPYVPPDDPNPPQPPRPPVTTNIYFKAGMKDGKIIPYQTPLKEITE